MKELHFYPGQHLMVIITNGIPGLRFEAWGGPEFGGTDPRMPQIPTTPGSFVIHSMQQYTTPSWPASKIKWGTALKVVNNDVWYQLPSGKWGSINQLFSINNAKQVIKDLYFSYYKSYTVPNTWVFNDFGPIAIRYFKDLNGNGVLDGGETLSGEMMHTTPLNEAQTKIGDPVKLEESHGCIHLKPTDRDQLKANGMFLPGTSFIVHRYDERI